MDIIGPLQLRVMHFIWKHGPATVHAVHSHLNAQPDSPTLAYTTILTVMRNLAKRGVLDQQPIGRSHRFAPLIDERTYQFDVLRQVRADLFKGDAALLITCLTEDPEIDRDLRGRVAEAVKQTGGA